MTINSDYAQYRDWGLNNHKDEKPTLPEEPKKNIGEPEQNQSDYRPIVKKHVTLPGWLSKKRGKAKL